MYRWSISLLVIILIVGLGLAAAPSRVVPPREEAMQINVYAASSAVEINAALARVGNSRKPVVLAPGNYTVDRTIKLPPGVRLIGYGAMLVAVKQDITMLEISEGATVQGITFNANAPNVTAIGGSFNRSIVRDCSFWTFCRYGINASGILGTIEGCKFGLSGPEPRQFQAIRIISPDHTANFWKVRSCDVYTSVGDTAVEFANGYSLEIEGCNFERNRTKVASLLIRGMFNVHIHDNWFEANNGPVQVHLAESDNRQIGNYVVNSHDNYWATNVEGNQAIYGISTAGMIHFHDEAGSLHGKRVIAESHTSQLMRGLAHLVGEAR